MVVTLKSLQGLTIEDYGVRLGRHWQIGQKGTNNGVLLIVAPNERKVRIEVGYGLEGTLTDAVAKFIIENSILPRFRANDVPDGVWRGADDIVHVLSGNADDWKERVTALTPSSVLTDADVDRQRSLLDTRRHSRAFCAVSARQLLFTPFHDLALDLPPGADPPRRLARDIAGQEPPVASATPGRLALFQFPRRIVVWIVIVGVVVGILEFGILWWWWQLRRRRRIGQLVRRDG